MTNFFLNLSKPSSLIILTILLISFVNCDIDDSHIEKSLYQITDSVRLLDSGNIYNLTNKSNYPWIINFYLHHCGHCRKFSNTFKRLAREVSGWKINIGVINCAINDTLKTCLDFNMRLYPTIAHIASNKTVSSDEISNVKIFTKSRSLNHLRNLAVDLVMDGRSSSNKPQLVSEDMLQNFYPSSKGDNLIITVFGDDDLMHLANTIFLDTEECIRIKVVIVPENMRNKTLEFIGINELKNKVNPKKRNLISFGIKNNKVGKLDDKNFEYMNKENSTFVIATRSVNDILFLSSEDPGDLTTIRKQLYRNFAYICPNLMVPFFVSTDKEINNKNVENYTKYDYPKPIVYELHIDDYIGAVSVSLRFEVARQDLDEKRIAVLSKWLDMVSSCISWPKVQAEVFNDLIKFTKNHTTGISFDQINNFLQDDKALKAFPLDPTWVNCAGSEPTYRGYPCAMWIAIHTMTIQCENKSNNQPNYDAIDVLKTVRSYVDNFFSCSYCRDHFLDMSKDVATTIKTPVEAIKWAWVSHNRVNARLRKDDSADPMHPKIQFPSKDLCPECHEVHESSVSNQNDIIITKPGFSVPDQKWNWPAVLMFLRYHYSPENILLSKEAKMKSSLNNKQNLEGSNYERNVDDEYASSLSRYENIKPLIYNT